MLDSWRAAALTMANAVVSQLVSLLANFVPAEAPVHRLETAVKAGLLLFGLATLKSFLSVRAKGRQHTCDVPHAECSQPSAVVHTQ